MTGSLAYQRIWLVGASSGIGAALVKALDEPGRTLYLSARNAEAMEALAEKFQADSRVLPMDMTQPEQVQHACERIAQDGGLDLVILNAGTCEYMDSADLDLALLRRVMETNFFAVTSLMKQSLDLLRQGKSGSEIAPKLVVVSSSVTYQALPRAHAYGASKVALRYFTECLKADIQHEGIDVQVVSPGFVETPLTDLNDFDMPAKISAEEAAQEIVKGLKSNRFDIHFPKRFTRSLKAFSCLPEGLRFKLLGKMSRHSEQMH